MSLAFRLGVYPFLWLISVLPFPLLYAFSDFLTLVIYRIVGYRKAVVRQNLKNSFPDKSDEERLDIEKRYYKHLSDLILETIKGMTISKSELQKRMVLTNKEVTDRLNEQQRSAVIVMSHNGNWEWVCLAAQISVTQHAQCVYKTLTSPGWDAWFLNLRSRFGTQPFPMEKTLRVMSENARLTTVTAFIGDQNPSSGKNAYWSEFLHQETCFMNGSEKIARKLNHSVYYLKVRKLKRGYYQCSLELIVENPVATKEGEITEAIVRHTESDILEQPENWLWSHRRWKHKREQA